MGIKGVGGNERKQKKKSKKKKEERRWEGSEKRFLKTKLEKNTLIL